LDFVEGLAFAGPGVKLDAPSRPVAEFSAMTVASVVERIRAYDRGREPERLALKYRSIRQSPFRFFRGTCHLFYEDWPRETALNDAPLAWISGDLHLENFGSFRGENRLVYFDLNDFDEAALADGKARWVERSTAQGMVRSLLRGAKRRTQAELLQARTTVLAGERRLRVDRKRALPIPHGERAPLLRSLRALAGEQPDPRFFRVLDVARRVAGTGSLGLRRYVVLVRGSGTPDGAALMDLKEARPSALAPHLKTPQPRWSSPAERVVAIQRSVQAASPALLRAVKLDGVPFVACELQPTADRLDLNRWGGKLQRLERVMGTMGEVVAWGQLRSGGRMGSATTDAWQAFARQASWGTALLRYARRYAERATRDWEEFRRGGPGGDPPP
jgi:uncharacterized protein (DUF2252 family)